MNASKKKKRLLYKLIRNSMSANYWINPKSNVTSRDCVQSEPCKVLLNTVSAVFTNHWIPFLMMQFNTELFHFTSSYLSFWLGGAMVMVKLSVPWHLTNLDNGRARAYCACSRSGRGWLDIFLSSIFSLSFLPLSERWPSID